MSQFAIPTPDENLVPGWNVQGNFASSATVGVPGQGYASPAAVPAPTAAYNTQSQANAGFPNPPGAFNIGAENSGAYTASILTNPGYADGNTIIAGTGLTAPNVTTTGVQSPYGLSAQATIVYPSGATAIYVAPFQTTGIPAGTSAPWVAVLTGNAAAGTISVSVPAAGYLKTVGANATSTTYVPVF
jgi:hypothetical protein